MKKLLALLLTITISLMSCGEYGDGKALDDTKTTFAIINLSSYDLLRVEYSSVDFGTIKSGLDIEKEVSASTRYIFFFLRSDDGVVRCRTNAVVTCEKGQRNEFIFTNTTIITTGVTERTDTVRNIFNTLDTEPVVPFQIGDIGPGDGIVFFAQGGQYKEVSDELGTYNWNDAKTTANNFRAGGFTNWRLPDRGELDLIYQNLHIKGLGGFMDTNYWSSSEFNTGYAWYQNFSNGDQDRYYSKQSAYRVRAVRGF